MKGRSAITMAETLFPGSAITTRDLIDRLEPLLSDDFQASVLGMGINQRFSVVEDLPSYALGERVRELSTSNTKMAADAVRRLLHANPDAASTVDAVVAVTNTADRALPGFAFELMGALSGRIPVGVKLFNLANAGCSSLLKALELAFLLADGGHARSVLVVVSEAHTGYVASFGKAPCRSYRELRRSDATPAEWARAHQMIGTFLFGDGAAALLVEAEAAGGIRLQNFAHRTNTAASDTEILRMNQGGILEPNPDAFPVYEMDASVPSRSAAYAANAIRAILSDPQSGTIDSEVVDRAQRFLIHTGSRKILNGVCRSLGLAPGDPRASVSHAVLRDHANLSSVSVGIMLARLLAEGFEGEAIALAFGVGFSATAALVRAERVAASSALMPAAT